MLFVDIVLAGLAFLGHTAVWVIIFNRLHALGLKCRHVKRLEKAVFLVALAILITFACWFATTGQLILHRLWESPLARVALAYLAGCWLVAVYVTAAWVRRKLFTPQPLAFLSNHTETLDIAREMGHRPLGTRKARLFGAVPGNELLRLNIHEKSLAPERLPRELDGLSVVHLTDLHMTGQLTKDYYRFIVDQANQLDADIVAITGDILEKPHCIDWIPDTLGRLRSRYGTYFVIGNHEERLPDVARLRQALTDAGLVDLGSRWMKLEIRGVSMQLAGNELPWFGSAEHLADERPVDSAEPAFRLLLSHSPDQIHWARAHNFDLMLAGHTHGGQIRLPLIGPIVCPSRYGIRYASGVFYEPPTLMHVSRGISSLHPIRFNCPPELTKIVLKCARNSE